MKIMRITTKCALAIVHIYEMDMDDKDNFETRQDAEGNIFQVATFLDGMAYGPAIQRIVTYHDKYINEE